MQTPAFPRKRDNSVDGDRTKWRPLFLAT